MRAGRLGGGHEGEVRKKEGKEGFGEYGQGGVYVSQRGRRRAIGGWLGREGVKGGSIGRV